MTSHGEHKHNSQGVEPLWRQLERIRAAAFVGRESELELFDSLLSAETLDQVLLVSGHGGAGKSTLLNAYRRRAAHRGIETSYVNARDLPQEGPELANQLDRHLPPPTEPSVLMIDTFELIASLEGWLRDAYLPSLPETVRVVIAGRWEPATNWFADPGWASLTHHRSLRDFNREEIDAYLGLNALDTELGEPIQRVTHGHPLAVGMLTARLREDPQYPIGLEDSPGIVDALVVDYLDATEDKTARQALYASSITRSLSRRMLADLLELPDAQELFEWLSQLSFVHRDRRGLHTHELVGESLRTELKQREPQLHQELVRRTARYLADRVASDDSEAAIQDLLFALRELPGIRDSFVVEQDTGLHLTQPKTADGPELAEIVARHEGAESQAWFAFWWQRYPENFRVLKDRAGAIAGLALYLDVTQLTTDEQQDPPVALYLDHLRRLGRLPSGRRASLCRFVMATESYQSPSRAMTQLLCYNALRGFRDVSLAHQATVREDTSENRYQARLSRLTPLPGAEFRLGCKSFFLMGASWITCHPGQWLMTVVESALGEAVIAGESQAAERLVDPDTFGQAVQSALKAFAQGKDLSQTLLADTRLVGDRMRRGEQASEALAATLREGVRAMATEHGSDYYANILRRTYISPAPKQVAAAANLGLTYGTYRRHLREAVHYLSQQLWEQETSLRQHAATEKHDASR